METQQEQTEQTEQTPPAEQSSQTTSTPASTEAPPQPNKLLELMEANMREQAQRLREQDRVIQDLQTRRQSEDLNPPIQAGQDAEAFWRDPAANIQKLIRDETQRAVKPLYDFKTQMERQSGYDSLKSRFRSDRRYAEMFPKIEGLVDQLMSSAEPNEQNMQLAVLSAIGTVVTGQAPGVTIGPSTTATTQPNNGQPPTQETRVITPAHLRSSPSQQMPETNAPKLRDLTELEERLRKERSQSKEEYLAWLDLPATEVAGSQLGKMKKDEQNPNPQSQVQRNVNQGSGR